MDIPPNESYFWIALRQIFLGSVLIGFAAFAYHNKMGINDIIMICTAMTGLLGIDVAKHNVAPRKKIKQVPAGTIVSGVIAGAVDLPADAQTPSNKKKRVVKKARKKPAKRTTKAVKPTDHPDAK